MKKFLSTLLLLAVAVLPMATMAQGNLVVTIGDGTTNSYYSPFNNYYHYSTNAAIYTAAEVGHSGSISSISFDCAAAASLTFTELKIYMGVKNDATFSSTTDWPTDLQEVYSCANCIVGAATGWQTFTLNTPFYYNMSEGNLVIVVTKKQGSYSSSQKWNYTATTDAILYRQNDSDVSYADVTNTTTVASTSYRNYRANIQLSIDTNATAPCTRPGAITISDLTATSVNLSFTPGASETSWIGEINPAVGGVSSMPLTTTSMALTGLTSNTTYTVGVKSICSVGDTSAARTATFTTPCATIANTDLPYVEDFNSYGTGSSASISACWHKGTTSSTAYPYPNNTSTYVMDGNYLYFYGYQSSSTSYYSYAALPDFESNVSNLLLSFKLKRYNSTTTNYTTYMVVGVMTDPTDIATFVGYDTIDLTTATTGSVHNVEVNFANYTGANGNIALLCPAIIPSTATSTTGYNYCYVDDVTVDQIPSCWTVTNLDGTTEAHSATLSWTERNSATSWEITAVNNDDATATPITAVATTNPYTMTGLDDNTSYTFAVKAICVPGTDTASATIVTLRTKCEPMSLPYAEDFNSYATGSAATISPCWTKGTTSSTAYPYPYSSINIDGTNCLYFYASQTSSASYYSYAALPAMDTNISNLMMSFQMKRYSTTTYTSYMVVGVMADPTDIATFVGYDTIDLTMAAASSVHDIEVIFDNYTGAEGCIAFLCPNIIPSTATGTSGYNYAYIDNVVVDVIPSCWTVTNLAVVDSVATENSVTLSWTERNASANQWSVSYVAAGSTTMNSVVVNSNPATISGLDANTAYTFYVSPICAAGDTANAKSVMGRTSCPAQMTLPYSENFDGYTALVSSSTAPSNYPNHELPACWNVFNLSATSITYPQAFITAYSNYAVEGNCLFFKSSSSTPIYAVLPTFTSPVNMLQIGFTYRNEGTTASNGTLWLGVMTDPTDASTFVEIASYPQTTTLTAVMYDFSMDTNLPAGNLNIAFRYTGGTASNYYLSIDNVEVSVAPTCKTPINIALDTVTETSATLTWEMPLSYTAANYTVAYGAHGFDVEDTTTWLGSVSSTTMSATISGLEGGTSYTAAVRGECSATEMSNWSSRFGFTTACATTAHVIDATHSMFEGFDGAEVNPCWTIIYADSANATDNPVINIAETGSIGNCLRFSSYSSNTNTEYHQYIVSPEFTGTDMMKLSFRFKVYGSTDSLWVGASNTTNELSSFTWFALPYTTSWVNASQALPAGYKYVAFQYNGTYAYYGYIDEVQISQYPQYTVVANVNDSVMGTVNGATGLMYENTEDTLVAVANTGYHFVNWSNGATTDTIIVTVLSDTTLTANFAPDTFTVNVVANNTMMGTVEGAGSYAYNTTATLIATPATGYQLASWSNGATTDTIEVTVLSDTTFTATFAIAQYTVTAVANDSVMGTVTGAGVYHHGATATLTATANTGYHFVEWNDNDTNATRTITVTADADFVATFAANMYTIAVAANDDAMGTVTGAGSYAYNTTATLTATANEGYHFVEWNDGNTDATRTITVTEDATYTATFAANMYTITVNVNDAAMGTATGAGEYAYNTTATLTATANNGFHFVEWNDGNTEATRTITVTADATYTATFAADQAETVTVVLSVNNEAMGYTNPAAGTYTYNVGDTVSAEAFANEGYKFVSWNVLGQEFTTNPIEVVIPAEAAGMTVSVVATFAPENGISDIDANSAVIYTESNKIVVTGAENATTYVYDVVGRCIAKAQGNATFAMDKTGVYLVKVGNAPAQRVVVVK